MNTSFKNSCYHYVSFWNVYCYISPLQGPPMANAPPRFLPAANIIIVIRNWPDTAWVVQLWTDRGRPGGQHYRRVSSICADCPDESEVDLCPAQLDICPPAADQSPSHRRSSSHDVSRHSAESITHTQLQIHDSAARSTSESTHRLQTSAKWFTVTDISHSALLLSDTIILRKVVAYALVRDITFHALRWIHYQAI